MCYFKASAGLLEHNLSGIYLTHSVSYEASLLGMWNPSSLSLWKSGGYSYSYQVIL